MPRNNNCEAVYNNDRMKEVINISFLSRIAFATIADCEVSLISYWIKGERKPRSENIIAIANAFGLGVVNYIYDLSNDIPHINLQRIQEILEAKNNQKSAPSSTSAVHKSVARSVER